LDEAVRFPYQSCCSPVVVPYQPEEAFEPGPDSLS
jgi:hypothetical protein